MRSSRSSSSSSNRSRYTSGSSTLSSDTGLGSETTSVSTIYWDIDTLDKSVTFGNRGKNIVAVLLGKWTVGGGKRQEETATMIDPATIQLPDDLSDSDGSLADD